MRALAFFTLIVAAIGLLIITNHKDQVELIKISKVYKPNEEKITAVDKANIITGHSEEKKEDVIKKKEIKKSPKVASIEYRKSKTSTKASDPIYTGKKERYAEISEKDEYYLDEYTNEKFTINVPLPIKAKAENDKINWKLKLNASVCGKVVSHDGKIFFATYDKRIYAVDPNTAKILYLSKLWHQPIGNPFIYKDTIIFPQRNGNITACYLKNLKRKWNSRSAVYKKKDEIDISISGAVLHKNKILISKHWGNLYIISADTGSMLMDPGIPYESRINLPAVSWGSKVIYANVAGELLCFSDDGKKEEWKREIKEGYLLSMIRNGNKLICTTTQRKLICIDLISGETLWEKELMGYGFNSITIVNNFIYVAAGNLYKFSLDGKKIWTVSTDNSFGISRMSYSVTKNFIYVCDQGGNFSFVYNTNGHTSRIVKVIDGYIWNELNQISDTIYISNDKNEVISLDLN